MKDRELPGNLSIGKYSYDPSRYELKFQDNVRKLSHREATLLTLLAKNKNAITSRKDILLQLWGDDLFFNSRNLDVYISKLHDLLKQDPLVQVITIKGIGLSFCLWIAWIYFRIPVTVAVQFHIGPFIFILL
jgi:DNA-binding response OmpR family regulator